MKVSHETSSSASLPTAKPRNSKRSTPYILRTLVAGGFAGCAAKTVIAPMDRVKILFQTDNPRYIKYSGVFRAIRDIYSANGITSLFQGHSATLLRIFPYAAIKFMSYEQYKDWIMPRREDETPLRRTIAGSLAGVSSLFVSYPLDLLRTRLAYEIRSVGTSPGLVQTWHVIYNESNPISMHNRLIGGMLNFYRGFVPTMFGIIPYAGVSFMCYEGFKVWALEREGWWTTNGAFARKAGTMRERDLYKGGRQLTWWSQLTIGGLSGLIAQTSSYPFEVIRRHMQIAGRIEPTRDGAANSLKKFPTTLEMTRFIYQKRGFRGFFVGLSIGFMKVVPMHADTYRAARTLFVVEKQKREKLAFTSGENQQHITADDILSNPNSKLLSTVFAKTQPIDNLKSTLISGDIINDLRHWKFLLSRDSIYKQAKDFETAESYLNWKTLVENEANKILSIIYADQNESFNGILARLTVIQAEGLKPKDFNGSNNPYVIINYAPDSLIIQSSAIDSTLNPELNFSTTM
ncbi:hypothetical protein HK100_005937 [Physocladia obscura]|uniref:C2 domain-containing protein n=1 Tax=Physocladia obscura TaxID=109957 RepID=A0AAD5XJ55_9FUNG|nr:hypothetical protein HK100_005937 [Physocladia obscura]